MIVLKNMIIYDNFLQSKLLQLLSYMIVIIMIMIIISYDNDYCDNDYNIM